MSKTTTTTNLGIQPANPTALPARIRSRHFGLKTVAIIFLVISVLILSTSFQSGRNEMVRIESEYLIPGLINGLRSTLSDNNRPSGVIIDGENLFMIRGVRQFYGLHGYRPAWTSYNRLNRHGVQLMNLIENARNYGLEPVQYHQPVIRHIEDEFGNDANRSGHGQMREQLELLLTDAALKLMVNLHNGYVAFDTALYNKPWTERLPAIILDGISHDKPVESILSVQPQFIEYTQLQLATVNFVRHTQLSDDSLTIAEPISDSLEFYGQVKQALARLGYTGSNDSRAEISASLKEFQLHHGLEPDGKPGKNTLEALRMTSLYQFRMLALNLDRLRKQDNSGMHLLYVNIPAYQLKVFKANQLQETYRVIVGSPKTPTPQLFSKVERVIANPVWDVPQSITQNELIPKIKADSNYLRRNRFKLVDRNNRTVSAENVDIDRINDAELGYKLRQDASSDNALGKVKFIFANPYAVYLHDTPGKALFTKDIRDLSHGCIRLQNPEKLADYIFKVIQSDSTDIAGLIAKGVHREFNLAITIPIHISYITCSADDQGSLYFYRDIYGIDRQELADLAPLMGI
jgi:L,D-transpeptidase YcbB